MNETIKKITIKTRTKGKTDLSLTSTLQDTDGPSHNIAGQ